jgi:hypothetical protein
MKISLFKDIDEIQKAFEDKAILKYSSSNICLRVALVILLSPAIVIYFILTRGIHLGLRLINSFFLFFFLPFKVIRHHYLTFFIWVSFTLFGGLMGVIVNIMRNMWFIKNPVSLSGAISLEMMNGTFYTYSIAIVAGVICGIFIFLSEAKKDDLNFRGYQIVIVSVSIFIILFGGVFYALARGNSNNVDKNHVVGNGILYIDWQQIVVFVLAIVISVFSFCVVRMSEHKKEFKQLIAENEKEELIENNPLRQVEVRNDANMEVNNA